MNKEIVIITWAIRGIEDLYLAFVIQDKFKSYVAFFYAQGLEKICKAYILGTKASEYEHLSEKEARETIDSIAKNLRHNLNEMIKKLVSNNTLSKDVLTRTYKKHNGKDITGEKIIEILKKAYDECRYPVPESISQKYPIKGYDFWWDPIVSSEPRDFTYEVAREIIDKIEKDFSLHIPRERDSFVINDYDWTKFCREFFKE